MNQPILNRRAFERFRVNPGYTAVSVRVLPDEEHFSRKGHVYDLSEGGVQFELDFPIDAGSTVSMKIDVPWSAPISDAPNDSAVYVTGNVVWTDTEEPGAARMALAITRYDREGDKERLIRALGVSRCLRAA